MPTLLYGWKVDPSAIGLVSWISPSGGGVDFLHSGDELPDGRVVPQAVPITDSLEFPIADLSSIFKMKLNSFREGDIKDLSILAKKCGIPELGKLNKQQKENLDYLKIIIGL